MRWGIMMNKKRVENKHKKHEIALPRRVQQMNERFLVGNFHVAREIAHIILRSGDATDEESLLARGVLRMTFPDLVSLGAGFLCLAFSVGVAFLAAY